MVWTKLLWVEAASGHRARCLAFFTTGPVAAVAVLGESYMRGIPVPTPVEVEEALSLESTSTLKVFVTRRVRDQVWKATRTFRRQ